MSAHRVWAFSPNSGGKKIPDLVRIDVEKRINDVAEQQLKGTFVRLDLSIKGQFCYIDAFTEPAVDENWEEEIFQETKEEHVERLRNSPLHLCRLRHLIRINGALHTIITAVKSMSWLLIPMVSSSENLKMHFWLLLRFIDRYKSGRSQ